MKELLTKYYNLFQWENGDNTCFVFTVSIVVVSVFVIVEIISRKRKGKSLFF